MSTDKPYYRRYRPAAKFSKGNFVRDELNIFVDWSDPSPRVGRKPAPSAISGIFGHNRRAAAVINAIVGDIGKTGEFFEPNPKLFDFLDVELPGERDRHKLVPARCLAALAYTDYFDTDLDFAGLVSGAIAEALPGWSGTFGKNVTQQNLLLGPPEGNYDMGQMFMTSIAYGFYDELDDAARYNVIHELLGGAKVDRVNLPEITSSGPLPGDWMLAGIVKYGLIAGVLTGWGPGPVVATIGETENHIFCMLTARYLANQLLFQRTHDERYDNRRNGLQLPFNRLNSAAFGQAPSCMALVLQLMRDVLQGDFSEYNAKPYQREARWALLALSSYSYDHEVRLAARMVLDYLSAKFAVSSSDLRRVVPFRRRNEPDRTSHSSEPAGPLTESGCGGVMMVSLTTGKSADPLFGLYALQTGNTRCCRVPQADAPSRTGLPGPQDELSLEVVSDYRVPPSILDLFVNNTSRRYFQRLHRRVIERQPGGNRNADNMEIYAGSASYLITAGGEPADYAIDPRVSVQNLVASAFGTLGQVGGFIGGFLYGAAVGGPIAAVGFALVGAFSGGTAGAGIGYFVGAFASLLEDSMIFSKESQQQQKGVAVTTSFIPAAGNKAVSNDPLEGTPHIIQFSCFSDEYLPADPGNVVTDGLFGLLSRQQRPAYHRQGVANYGVAPDFACGHDIFLPDWMISKTYPLRLETGEWTFGDFGSPRDKNGVPTQPGFYIAVFRGRNGFAILEAFDTLLYSEQKLSFDDFKTGVLHRNGGILLQQNVSAKWKTTNGNVIEFVIWSDRGRREAQYGAEVLSVDHADSDSPDARGDAGVDKHDLVNGTILNAEQEAVITIDNLALGTRIRLDLSDPTQPQRTAEDGSIESAGANEEVWTDFDWQGNEEGDVYRPYSTMAAAAAAVCDGGTIRMIPSQSAERTPIGNGKRFKLVAPIGDVKIGVT